MLRILAIRLLLAFSLPSDLGGVPDPQLKVQFRQQSLEPARMPAGFHPHAHFHSLGRELTVELLRCLLVGWHHQSLLGSREPTLSWNQLAISNWQFAFWPFIRSALQLAKCQ